MISRNVLIGFLFGGLIYCLAIYIGVNVNCGVDNLIDAYQKYMRGYVFSAYLGISSFLLSLLTFVVINLKEKMFDSADYKNIYIKFNKLNLGDDISKKELYKPLVVITTALVISIICCIVSSILQFTLGFSNNKYILIIPTLMPFIATSFMLISLYQMTQLIYQWLRAEGVIKVV
ncbi:hypothetical protein SJI19_19605 [Acerihabitans sp. TG2]|uniref:hypothetical protein n=1 Tax=Acerihabitans sp. TG2 TaxID=3096008 RepID=UPI002B22F06B|nr:hypothetical protein [Acerihabitans sp. TG2]MEA9392715.1 hypothetical protein [Acerihabitans sp. TG2]